MTWVGWRLQRTETLIAVGILALLAALLVPTGLSMADAYAHDGLRACLGSSGPVCGARIGSFRERFQSLIDLSNWFTLVPGLIGVLLAAPFVFDIEQGTYRLVWTQSITRGRWLLGKLGVAVAAALVASGALTALFTWWRTPTIQLDGRLDNGTFDSTGVVVFGYTLFAFAVAAALGVVWRRAAASLTVGFVAYFAARVAVEIGLRKHLLPAHVATWRGAGRMHVLDNALVLSQQIYVGGREVSRSSGLLFGNSAKVAVPALSKAVFHTTYLPTSDYWPLQIVETGLFAGAAALLVAFAVWWTRRRIA